MEAYGHWSYCAYKNNKGRLRECNRRPQPLCLRNFTQTAYCAKRTQKVNLSALQNSERKRLNLSIPAHCRSGRSGYGPCAACNDLLTCLALPDADRLPLHAVLNERDEDTYISNRVCL